MAAKLRPSKNQAQEALDEVPRPSGSVLVVPPTVEPENIIDPFSLGEEDSDGYIKNISSAKLMGDKDAIKAYAQSGDGKPVWLYKLVAFIEAAMIGQTQLGDYYHMLGESAASILIGPRAGQKVVGAQGCFLQEPVQSMIVNLLRRESCIGTYVKVGNKNAGEPPAILGAPAVVRCTVGVVLSKKSIVGYEYVVSMPRPTGGMPRNRALAMLGGDPLALQVPPDRKVVRSLPTAAGHPTSPQKMLERLNKSTGEVLSAVEENERARQIERQHEGQVDPFEDGGMLEQ